MVKYCDVRECDAPLPHMANQMSQKPGVTVLTGDPHLPDTAKPGQRFNPEDLDTIARMKAALAALGHYDLNFIDRHHDLPARLVDDPPEFVLNLCDTGFRNRASQELHVAALLEILEIPHSGAAPSSMVLTTDKALVRALAQSLGVPVPEEAYFPTSQAAKEAAETLAYPALIKPNRTDGSLGITKDAVVDDAEAARDYLDMLAGLLPGRDILVQEFLSGAEYGMVLIGNPDEGFYVPPPLTVDYSGLPGGLAPILSYESKTIPDSPYWSDIRYLRADLPDAAVAAMRVHAERLFVRMGCSDYARFDFRADAAGTVKLLEVNVNPAWSFDGKMAIMCGFDGMAYGDMLDRIICVARRRYGLSV